jgi:hypothetical protein
MARAIVDVKSISEEPTGLELWNRLEFTDKAFTKPVDRSGFKGTAVDPVYNLKRVTQELGPVGFAWGWKVLNERLDTFGAGDEAVTVHSLTVRAWFKQHDNSLLEVDHIGHTKVCYRTRGQNARLVIDEEFGKKSLTDALSKIMMSLGASADIWLGRFDGNKYVPSAEVEAESKPRVVKTTAPAEEPEMKELVHIVDAQGEVICTTSVWQEALRRYGEIKKCARDAQAVQRANLPALRKMLPYTHTGTHDKLQAEITIIENLPTTAPQKDAA